MKHASIPFFSALLLAGCDPTPSRGPTPEAPLVMVAGMDTIPPTTEAEWTTRVDRSRLGFQPGERVTCYELTTPAGEPFQFDVLSRRQGNTGDVVVALAHAADGGGTPGTGLDSIAQAGMIVSATGTQQTDPWLEAWGSGFSRISLRGTVQGEQILALRADNGEERVKALVRIAIGPRSAINVATRAGGDYPGVLDSRTIYSSNSWLFGLPTAAVSGDRTTVVAYEGDRADPTRWQRYEMRLQVDHQTNAVTGGASLETSPDSGNWRDHEIAGLFNTLAIVHCGGETVGVRLSYDRGASFPQSIELARLASWSSRLCQIAMAADYSLAVTFWRTRDGLSELVLARGAPSAFDPQGSPTWYEMQPPLVLRTVAVDMSPLLMGLTWSEGGDLVIGYAYTTFTVNADLTRIARTSSRCAVIPWQGTLRDVLVDEEQFIGRDPSVSVLGSGDSMRVLYAYEGRGGVRLCASTDGGRTFTQVTRIDDGATAMPAVLARMQGGHPRVDLLFLAQTLMGQELHLRHWDDFDSSIHADFKLTRAAQVPSASVPRSQQVPGAGFHVGPPGFGIRITEVHWFGYDAVLEGDDVVVVLDEITYDAVTCLGGMRVPGNAGTLVGPTSAGFAPATPPPLAPGLTQAVPPPNSNHLHQLKMLRLD